MSIVRNLKTHPTAFQDVWDGRKPFEFRKDDRDPPFAVDDILVLKDYEPKREIYSGRMIYCCVSCIYRGPSPYGIPDGYCVMGLYELHRYAPEQPESFEVMKVPQWRAHEFPAYWPGENDDAGDVAG
jgi:hypothetical protein